jgi:adenosylcobinamide-GDP ribazoletransferase
MIFVDYLRFFTRLPVPGPHGDGPTDFSWWSGLVLCVGMIVGGLGGLVLVAADAAFLPPALSAALAVAALVLISGGLHEDGLADVCDGFGGGKDKESKLAIMKDSRLGTYGAIGLVLSLLARVLAVAALLNALGGWGALLCIAVAGGVSRVLCLMPLVLLPPARQGGLAGMVVPPRVVAYLVGLVVCAGLAFVTVSVQVPPVYAGFAFVLACVSAWLLCLVAFRHIGGHSGDVCGAVQQISEITFLLCLVSGVAP